MNTRNKKIFLCHLSEDSDIVDSIAQKLASYGVYTWVDYDDLLPGENWKQKIEREIDTTDGILVFISKLIHSKESFIHKEIQLAIARSEMMPPNRIFIIPLLMENNAPILPNLKNFHHIQISEPNWFEKILKALSITPKSDKIAVSYRKKQEIIEIIEENKDKLIQVWVKRDSYTQYSEKWNVLENAAVELVDNIIYNSQLIGEQFDSKIHYRKLKIQENKKRREFNSKNDRVYLAGSCVCVPSRFIGKHIYIVEKDESPKLGHSADGRVVNHIIKVKDSTGKITYKEKGDGWVNHRGIIKSGYTYDIYDDFNEGAYLIGTVKA